MVRNTDSHHKREKNREGGKEEGREGGRRHEFHSGFKVYILLAKASQMVLSNYKAAGRWNLTICQKEEKQNA